jgi:hypothetical protein
MKVRDHLIVYLLIDEVIKSFTQEGILNFYLLVSQVEKIIITANLIDDAYCHRISSSSTKKHY